MSISYKGRFAPSPSGPLHLGSLVAALGSYAQARSQPRQSEPGQSQPKESQPKESQPKKNQDAQWFVRIDDIDPPRVVKGASDAILRCLEAHGFAWDGPVQYQSHNSDSYQQALSQLRQQNLLYDCDCSRKQLIRQQTPSNEHGLIYPGHCQDKTCTDASDVNWRIRTSGFNIDFEDLIYGRQSYDLNKVFGDIILRRRSQLFAYQLACAIDDQQQYISEVIRGLDLLAGSAQQIFIRQQLGLDSPSYGHLPLIQDNTGTKLSKASGAAALDNKHALNNLLLAWTFLNQSPPPELTSVADFWEWAIAEWQLSRVQA